ncbi:MAG: glycosyltransferase [Desulfatitalea sp.]
MIEVTALTSGRDVPSARFRVRQHITELRHYGIVVRERRPPIDKYADMPGPLGGGHARRYLPPLYWTWAAYRLAARLPGVLQSRSARVVWLEREIQPGVPTFERLIRKPMVFDVDDAIWLKKPAGRLLAQSIARRAEAIIAGNTYIADWFSAYHRRIHIIPTAVDVHRFTAAELTATQPETPFIIGWTGTHSNFKYLYAIEKGLNRFLSLHNDAILHIIADRSPAFTLIQPHKHHFIPWQRGTETAALSKFAVGIMPLADDEWTRGKCAYKMLQYMAAGVPVVVSPVGMNLEVLAHLEGSGLTATRDGQWTDALDFIYRHRDTARTWGAKGREVAEKYYSTPVVAAQLAAVFSPYQ